MERFYASLKTLRPMQILVLVVALLVSGGATYAGYEVSSGSPSNGLEEDQQLVPIGFGDLVRQVTTSGSLEFPNSETLSFGTGGRVDRLLVRVGQSVTAGQELALLDSATTATLVQSVAQAQVDVITAQKLLDELAQPTDLVLAQARRDVASAEFDLQSANDALDDANIPFSQDQIKTQEQAVAIARLKVDDTEEALAGLGLSFSTSLAQALLDEADAKAAAAAAKKAMDAYQAANAQFIDQAKADQAVAQANYDEIALRLENLLASQAAGGPRLEGQIIQTQEVLTERKVSLDDANVALVPLEQLVTKKEKEDSDLAAAKSALADLGAGPTSSAVEERLAEIEGARTTLASVLDSGLDATVAEAELAALRLGLSAVEIGANLVQVRLLERDHVQARVKLPKERESLADMIAGPDAVTVVFRSRQVDVAAASLEQANQDLADVLSPSAADLALLESKLAAAQATLSSALDKLEDSSIKAPFAGFISLISVSEGDQVGANAAIVEVVDPSVVEMDGIVDEIDILLLSEGLFASVTVDALPGRVLEGFVSEIAPVANVQQGVVTYPVRVRVQVPDDVQLRDGLSAVAGLVLEQQLNVLLIPQQAIFGAFQEPTVLVETESGIVERAVLLGSSDDFWTEVKGGLQAGDRVVMQSSQASTDPFGAFRQFRSFGGGGGGGGRRGGVVVTGDHN